MLDVSRGTHPWRPGAGLAPGTFGVWSGCWDRETGTFRRRKVTRLQAQALPGGSVPRPSSTPKSKTPEVSAPRPKASRHRQSAAPEGNGCFGVAAIPRDRNGLPSIEIASEDSSRSTRNPLRVGPVGPAAFQENDRPSVSAPSRCAGPPPHRSPPRRVATRGTAIAPTGELAVPNRMRSSLSAATRPAEAPVRSIRSRPEDRSTNRPDDGTSTRSRATKVLRNENQLFKQESKVIAKKLCII